MARGKAKPKPNPRQRVVDQALSDDFLDNGRWTEKQRLFVLSYVRHNVAARAVREAGYACKWENASSIGCQLLNLAHVKQFVDENRAAQYARLAVSADRVQAEWAALGFFNMGRILKVHEDGTASLDLTQADATDMAALAGIEVEERWIESGDDNTPPEKIRTIKVKTHPKTQSLDSLAKYLKMIGGDLTVNLGVDLADELSAAKARLRAGDADAMQGDDQEAATDAGQGTTND